MRWEADDSEAQWSWPAAHTALSRAASAGASPGNGCSLAVRTLTGSEPSELIAATAANAAGPSRCSAFLDGSATASQNRLKAPAAGVPSSDTSQVAWFQAGGLASISTSPRTEAGNCDA